jgi:transformation/transcription domain-associated protein
LCTAYASALQMLGKLVGRSRCFLREPLELEAKSNPEHGGAVQVRESR